jgi:hypothetical protein
MVDIKSERDGEGLVYGLFQGKVKCKVFNVQLSTFNVQRSRLRAAIGPGLPALRHSGTHKVGIGLHINRKNPPLFPHTQARL